MFSFTHAQMTQIKINDEEDKKKHNEDDNDNDNDNNNNNNNNNNNVTTTAPITPFSQLSSLGATAAAASSDYAHICVGAGGVCREHGRIII